MSHFQVSKANLIPGEEVELRKAVRAMDAKRAIAEQCATAHVSMMGDSSGGGVAASLKAVENQLRGIAAKEGQMSE
jgi:DNA repair ATPase RecN